MALSNPQIRFLKGRAHKLRPVILVGQNGPSDAVCRETLRALRDHELIKVRLGSADRDERAAWSRVIIDATGADAVGTIGAILILYKRNPDRPGIKLPPG